MSARKPVPSIRIRPESERPQRSVARGPAPAKAPSDSGLIRITGSSLNYWAGFMVDVAGVVVFLAMGLGERAAASWLLALAAGSLGYLWWTLFEYLVHRFVFHGRWTVVSASHLAHHADPARAIGLPFFVAFLVALTLYGTSRLVLPMPYPYFFVAGAYFGWLCYGILHHVEHAIDIPLMRYRHLRRHHLVHHGAGTTNYGVTTTCWDQLFGTQVRRSPRGPSGLPASGDRRAGPRAAAAR